MPEQSSIDKSRAALTKAAEISAKIHDFGDAQGPAQRIVVDGMRADYLELTTIATIHAQVAQAEALTRMADTLERLQDDFSGPNLVSIIDSLHAIANR